MAEYPLFCGSSFAWIPQSIPEHVHTSLEFNQWRMPLWIQTCVWNTRTNNQLHAHSHICAREHTHTCRYADTHISSILQTHTYKCIHILQFAKRYTFETCANDWSRPRCGIQCDEIYTFPCFDGHWRINAYQ